MPWSISLCSRWRSFWRMRLKRFSPVSRWGNSSSVCWHFLETFLLFIVSVFLGTRRYSQRISREATRGNKATPQDKAQLNFHWVPRKVFDLRRLLCEHDGGNGHAAGCLQTQRGYWAAGCCKLLILSNIWPNFIIRTLYSNAKKTTAAVESSSVIFYQCQCKES